MDRLEAIKELQELPKNNNLDGVEIDALTLAIDTLKRIGSKEFYEFVWERCEADDVKTQEVVTYLTEGK